jgi:exosortase
LKTTNFRWTIHAISLISIWSILILQLSNTWIITDQYSHGFLVPLLCVYLFIKSPTVALLEENSKISILQGKTWLILGIPLVTILPIIWVIRDANPDWRLLNVVLYLLVLSLTIIPYYDQSGLKKVKNLLFPLFFFVVAIPWPLFYDLKLTQYFQEKISSIIVDILLILEHEAKLTGTVIDVGVFGQIGIDQACSGINGLQSSIVVSLFLGAYFKFKLINRLSLLLGGVLIAIAFNLLRAFSMSLIKVKGKGDLLENPIFSIWNWNLPNLHDLAGLIETFLILIAILILARSGKIGFSYKTLGDEPSNWSIFKTYPSYIYSSMVLISVIISFLLSKYHYEKSENSMVQLSRLEVVFNDNKTFSEDIHISKQIASQLHYAEAKSVQWQDRLKTRLNPYNQKVSINPNHEYWQLFQATWDSGGACTSVLSTHSPDSCLPLQGFSQVNPMAGTPPPHIPITIGENEALFETYEFAKNQKKFFVFRCFWPYLKYPDQKIYFPSGGYNFFGRIKSAIEGKRNVGGSMLAFAITNVISMESASIKLQNFVNDNIKFVQ